MLQPAEDLVVRARAIRALVLDVDGVLTDATLIYGARGESLKGFSARDGFAIKTAMQEGLSIAILSGRLAPPIKARVTDLGIAPDHVIQGSRNKRTDITTLAGRLGITLPEVAFMGDDLPDLPALTRVGLAACPADAAPEVRERCHFVAGVIRRAGRRARPHRADSQGEGPVGRHRRGLGRRRPPRGLLTPRSPRPLAASLRDRPEASGPGPSSRRRGMGREPYVDVVVNWSWT